MGKAWDATRRWVNRKGRQYAEDDKLFRQVFCSWSFVWKMLGMGATLLIVRHLIRSDHW